jgi:hypothetical protein
MTDVNLSELLDVSHRSVKANTLKFCRFYKGKFRKDFFIDKIFLECLGEDFFLRCKDNAWLVLNSGYGLEKNYPLKNYLHPKPN